MKVSKLKLILLFSATIFLNLSAQDKKEYPEPEMEEKMYYYDEANNSVVDLETGTMEESSRSSGFTGEEAFSYINGEHSNVRVKKAQKLLFMVRWHDDSKNPGEEFHLMKLKYNAKKKRREVVTYKVSTVITSSNKPDVNIFFKTKKVRETRQPHNKDIVKDVIRLFTLENLEAGEYVWQHGEREYLFFGIDE